MNYKNIVKGKFISRPNRFVANVEIDGKPETVHVKNTGRCRELLVPGCTVYLEDFDGRMGERKMRYSLIAVAKETEEGILLVNMDSQAPNKAAKEALEEGKIETKLGKLNLVKPETTYGNSRFDFYLEGENGKGFLEVKGCTLENKGIASFPDAPTIRGVKHVEELIKAKEEGYYAGILFIIQMEGMKVMTPNWDTHPEFGEALKRAEEKGVEILAYECEVSPETLVVKKKIEYVNKL